MLRSRLKSGARTHRGPVSAAPGRGREALILEWENTVSTFEEVFERIKLATNTRTQVELAEVLDIRQSSISDAKRRNSVPSDWYMKLFEKFGLNPDWLKKASGPMYLRTEQGYQPLDAPAAGMVLEDPARYGDPDAKSSVVTVHSMHCEVTEQGGIFQKYASVSKNKKLCFFIGDTLRVLLTSGGAAAELDKLMSVDIQVIHEVENMTPHNISHMAESMPGMGIVAAVLGVVLTMGKINAPPEELGHAIGAALVGTFLGILLCYGVFGPMAAKLQNLAHEEIFLYRVIREAVAASARGSPPIMALEFGRRAIPPDFRPTFLEMEEKLRG